MGIMGQDFIMRGVTCSRGVVIQKHLFTTCMVGGVLLFVKIGKRILGCSNSGQCHMAIKMT